MRAWVLIIGYLGLVSLHFYYPITLAYVSSRVLRPPWGHGIRCHIWQPLLGQVFEIWLIFIYHYASSSRRRLFDFWIRFSCGYWWLGLHIDDGLFDVIWFSNLLYIWCHIGANSLLVEICISPLIRMILPLYEIHVELMICFYFMMIPQWSLSWVIQSCSYFMILPWFSDGVILGT